MNHFNDYNDHLYFVISLKNGEIHKHDSPIITPSLDQQKTKATKIFASLVEKLQSLTPRINIHDLTLCLDDVCIVEIFFYDINPRDEKDMKYFHKLYKSLAQLEQSIETDFNDLPAIVPIKMRFQSPE